MSGTGDLDTEDLGTVRAELAIRNLVARMAQAADHGDLDEYAELFTEDGAWEFPPAPRRGRQDILAGAIERRRTGVTGPGSGTRHVITTLAVDVQGDSEATADSYCLFFRETTSASPVLFNITHYHDTIRFVDGSWRIARREITIG